MSQHADITKTCLAHAIRHDLSLTDGIGHLNDVLCCADYDDEYTTDDLPSLVKSYILSQKSGLYGVTHQQARAWLQKNK